MPSASSAASDPGRPAPSGSGSRSRPVPRQPGSGAPVPSGSGSGAPVPSGSDPGPPAPAGLWRDRDFRRLWLGQTASQLGEHASLVVLPLFAVLTLGAGAGELGLLRAVGQAPILLLSLFAGAWVDRWRTRRVMVLTDAGRSLALGAAAAAGLFGWLGLHALFVAAFAVGAFSVFFDVAYQASLVRLVRRDQLVRGNSALEGSRSAAQIGGPALGGALVSLLSAPVAAAAGALFFALSFLSVGGMRRNERMPERSGRPPRVWRGIREGVRFVAGDSSLRAVCLASAAFQFFFAAVMTVYLLFLPRELHLSGTAVGLALAATGPGALLGSVLAARLPGRFGHGVVLVSGAALGDCVFLCVPALHGSPAVTLPALLVINFVFGVSGQLVSVTVMAVRQAVTPDGMQGRAAATISFAGMGTAPLGSLLGGFLAVEWGSRTSLLVTAAGMLLSPAVIALSPLARLGRELPPAPSAPARPGTPGTPGTVTRSGSPGTDTRRGATGPDARSGVHGADVRSEAHGTEVRSEAHGTDAHPGAHGKDAHPEAPGKRTRPVIAHSEHTPGNIRGSRDIE